MSNLQKDFSPFIETIKRQVVFDEETTSLDVLSLQNVQHGSITCSSDLNIRKNSQCAFSSKGRC